ncbi:MAG: sigma-54-dependent Fis family transcriptional regulator, partial [bacterium]|nr:sigma-54-dependent Fis family transcriptional regulator [bacterium]
LLKSQLEAQGFEVDEAADLKTAAQKIKKGHHDVFVFDMVLPDGSSISLLEKFKEKVASRTIIVTANPSTSSVVEAIKKGAYNYLEKPVDLDLLLGQLEKIIEINDLRSSYQSVIEEISSNFTFDSIVYESKKMADIIARAKVLANTGNTLLLHGETGVGKEVLAHALHNHSSRSQSIFLPLNCAAIPQELFESELFGFDKGAFTGAVSNYNGRFIQAEKGTLFLDEIGELPLFIQAKLLRILDERRIYRLKSQKPVDIDVRLITATNRDLLAEVKSKQFRGDLYYRLQESVITIPPLRERQEDILPLFRHFTAVYNRVYNKEVTRIDREAEQYLLNHCWGGNIRELKNTVKSIIPFKTNDTIEVEDLFASIAGGGNDSQNRLATLDENEKTHLLKVLRITGFNISRSAEILGITRARLYRQIDRFDLKEAVEEE